MPAQSFPEKDILPFDTRQVRPGLRDQMNSAARLLEASKSAGVWLEGQITPDLIKSYFQPEAGLWAMSDATLSEQAEKGAILALQAVQDGTWADSRVLKTFMTLQSNALKLRQNLGNDSDLLRFTCLDRDQAMSHCL